MSTTKPKPLGPQALMVLDYLKSGRELTPLIATGTMGVSSVTTRISEIRRSKEFAEMMEQGWELWATWSKDHFEKRYKKYRLVNYQMPLMG